MGLTFVETRDGNHTGIVGSYVIKNSKTVIVGGAVRFDSHTTETIEDAVAGETLLGIVIDIVDANGTSLHAASTSDYDGKPNLGPSAV